MTKSKLLVSILFLAGCTSSQKSSDRVPAEYSNDYAYLEECDYIYRENLKGLFTPSKTFKNKDHDDSIFNFSMFDAVLDNPKSWARINFKDIQNHYSAIIRSVETAPRDLCVPENRYALQSAVETRYAFYNSLYNFVALKPVVKPASSRSFDSLLNLDMGPGEIGRSERRLMDAGSNLESHAKVARVDHKVALAYVDKLNKLALTEKFSCVRSLQKYNLHPEHTNYGKSENPIGNLVFCVGTEVSKQDYGVEGQGSDIKTVTTRTGILFWDLGSKNQEYLNEKYKYGYMVLGIYADSDF